MNDSRTATPALQIGCMEVPVADLGRAIAWYGAALGLNCNWSDEHHAMLSGVTQGGEKTNSSAVSVLLVQTTDPWRLGFQNNRNGLQHSVLDFRTADLEGLHSHQLQQGTTVDTLSVPANQWAPRGFGFLDSEGNRLGAFTYTTP